MALPHSPEEKELAEEDPALRARADAYIETITIP